MTTPRHQAEFSEVPEGGTASFKVIPSIDRRQERPAGCNGRWCTRPLLPVVPLQQLWNYEPIASTPRFQGKIGHCDGGKISFPSTGAATGEFHRRPDRAGDQLRVRRQLVCCQTSTETPDGLEVALDKAHHAPGESPS
jgi:hypothetical protein